MVSFWSARECMLLTKLERGRIVVGGGQKDGELGHFGRVEIMLDEIVGRLDLDCGAWGECLSI